MLVEFSLKNFRSFSERQTFSMVAGPSSRSDERYAFATNNIAAPYLLRSATLIGPNGSGKTNVIAGLSFVDDFVLNSAKNTQQGEPIEATAFKFHDGADDQISEFEIVFIENGNQYQYGIAVDRTRVHDEWMFRTPSGASQKALRMFDRYWDEQTKSYEIYINPAIKGQKETWRISTRSNASLFSTAVQLSAEAFQEPFNWFKNTLQLWPDGNRTPSHSTEHFCRDAQGKKIALDFLQAADLGIVDIKIERDKRNIKVQKYIQSRLKDKSIDYRFISEPEDNVLLGHRVGKDKVVYLDLEEESDGTQVLFGLIRPWHEALEYGTVVVMDELSNSLHPLVLAMLVDIFNDPRKNINNAQLIFTGHETVIMENNRLHRDQINIIQRRRNISTEIIPLSDFKPRADENFRRGYLQGRYKGVPMIGSW